MLDAFRELIDELLSAPAALRGAGLADSSDANALLTLALITERRPTPPPRSRLPDQRPTCSIDSIRFGVNWSPS